MKRKLTALLVIISLLGLLCSCGSQSDNNSKEPFTNHSEIGTAAPEPTVAPTHIPVLFGGPSLTKTATVSYDNAEAKYNNVILYRSDSKFGVLNNDGSIRIEASYDLLTALNEKALVFRNKDGETGLITADNEVLVTGSNITNIYNLGSDLVLLEYAIPSDKSNPYAVETTLGYCTLAYQIYSLKERSFLEIELLSDMHWINASDNISKATADNLFLYDYSAVTRSYSCYVYYFQSEEWIEIVTYNDFSDNGYTIQGTTLLDAKGNVLTDFSSLGYSSVGFECDCGEFYYAHKNDTYDLLSADGKVIKNNISASHHLSHKVSSESSHRNGKIIVCNRYDYGVVDYDGNEIIPFVYDEIHFYTEDTFAVRLNGCWGILDSQGRTLVEPTIRAEYHKYGDGFLIDDKKCLINPENGEITFYDYLSLMDRETPGIFSAYKENGRAIITPSKNLTEFIYNLHGMSIDVSKDGLVYSAERGDVTDIYVLNN